MRKRLDISNNGKSLLSLGPKGKNLFYNQHSVSADSMEEGPSHQAVWLQDTESARAQGTGEMRCQSCRGMETKYFNLSLPPFHFILPSLGQMCLEFKKLKNQVMKSIEVKTPGQRAMQGPAEKRNLVSMWFGWGSGVG